MNLLKYILLGINALTCLCNAQNNTNPFEYKNFYTKKLNDITIIQQQVYYKNILIKGAFNTIYIKNNDTIAIFNSAEKISFENINTSEKNIFWYLNQEKNKYILCKQINKKIIHIASNSFVDFAYTKRNFKDTQVRALVFYPDPLTSSHSIYGQPLRDSNDRDYPAINKERKEVLVTVRKKNDSLFLENQYIICKDFDVPFDPVPVEKKEFVYTRQNKNFEYINVYYHLSNYVQWLKQLQLENFLDTVSVDARAVANLDESYFSDSSGDISQLFIGIGNVDDGEDADVAVHEYSHSLFNKAVPNSFLGKNRQAIEEGICDYFAVAYSNKISSKKSAEVFSWDGHNEFWAGRNLANKKINSAQYITNQPHWDGEIVGAALYDLGNEIGDDTLFKIIVNAIPLMKSYLNFFDFGRIILFSDSVLYGGKYRWPITKHFGWRNLLPYYISTKSISKTNDVIIKNSTLFTLGTGDLFIEINDKNPHLEITTISGQKLQINYKKINNEYIISPTQFKPGIYLIKIGMSVVKVSRN